MDGLAPSSRAHWQTKHARTHARTHALKPFARSHTRTTGTAYLLRPAYRAAPVPQLPLGPEPQAALQCELRLVVLEREREREHAGEEQEGGDGEGPRHALEPRLLRRGGGVVAHSPMCVCVRACVCVCVCARVCERECACV